MEAALENYLEEAVIVEHVSTQEQIEGPVEQWEVTGRTLILGIHYAIFIPHFLDVFSNAFGALSSLLHFLFQLLDVLVVLLQGAADGLLRNHSEQRIKYVNLKQNADFFFFLNTHTHTWVYMPSILITVMKYNCLLRFFF